MEQKNVYDIKKEKNLNFILPTKTYCSPNVKLDVLIIIHLHYEDQIEEYFQYIFNIPSEIDIIFTTSNIKVKEALIQYQNLFKRKYQIIEKKNRGRDVSGLLVESGIYVLKYQFVCFVHDKKEKNKYTEKDTKEFKKCLWENTLGSNAYIHNIIYTFQSHPLLGVLLPPETLSDNFSFIYSNTWDRNYVLMEDLAKKMQLKCNLNPQKKPISLGTAFWARVSALHKLFEINWNYEDFDEEPLADDGTISHAIERSFAYIAQDAGYDTGIVMTDRFAGERFDKMQDVLTESFKMLGNILDIHTIGILEKENKAYKQMINFVNKYQIIYIYGAGVYGQRCARLLQASLNNVSGFIITKNEKNIVDIGGLPVKEFSEIQLNDKIGIIIAANEKNQKEIRELILKKNDNFQNLFYFTY